IDDDAGLVLADELLQASAFWNAHGLDADVVVIVAVAALRDALHSRFGAHAKQYPPPGGRQNLFAFVAEEAADSLLAGLATSAALVLEQGNGTLAEQVAGLPGDDDQAGRPDRDARATPRAQPSPAGDSRFDDATLEFQNGHGGFAEDGREYVTVIRGGVLPPMPWLNVVANPGFGFTATEACGGYAWSQNSQRNPITPWANDPVSDPPQEVLYVRDD